LDIPPGKSSNGTESRANEHFYWPPNSPKRLLLVRPGRGSHELGVYRLLAARLEPSFDDELERRPAFADAAKLDATGRMKMLKQDEVARTRARKSAIPQKRHKIGLRGIHGTWTFVDILE
jgi:hypothetical protein